MMATTTLLTSTKAYSDSTTYVDTNRILLRPRKYERYGGFLIVLPLLPKRKPLPSLPAEVWRKIFTLAMEDEPDATRDCLPNGSNQIAPCPRCQNARGSMWRWNLELICKDLKKIVSPLLYANIRIRSIHTLEKFTKQLRSSDQAWDSIRRIPYSTPGRWVQTLDLSDLEVKTRSEFCHTDSLLTELFPLVPFLTRLELTLSMQLSRRAMMSLGLRDGAQNLRYLSGVKYDATTILSGEDPLTELIACCSRLEELEVVGVGVEDLDEMSLPREVSERPLAPLHLSHLHTLTILSTPTSPLLLRLIHSPLPALQTVIITPYGDLQRPQSCIPDFLLAHGDTIQTLVFHTPKTWPISRFPPPRNLLHLLPNLTSLSLELAGLALDVPFAGTSKHPLTSLWISRPTSTLREELLQVVPRLPNLREVRARDVRWAKSAMSASARETGFQGEMCAWRRLLAPYRVKMLDADGLEYSQL